MHQCEMCNRDFEDEPIMGGRRGRSTFCSDECLVDAEDEIRMWDAMDRREFEIWGTDFDSWYR